MTTKKSTAFGMRTTRWTSAQVRKLGDDTMKRYQGVWPHIGKDLREGLVSSTVVATCSCRDDIQLTGKEVADLQYDLCVYLGVWEG